MTAQSPMRMGNRRSAGQLRRGRKVQASSGQRGSDQRRSGVDCEQEHDGSEPDVDAEPQGDEEPEEIYCDPRDPIDQRKLETTP